MKKPALIDLDKICKLSEKLASDSSNKYFSSIVRTDAANELFSLDRFVGQFASQPALVELLKSAIQYGVVFGMKNSEKDSVDLKLAFHQFLTQNNLTDEKEK